MYQQTIEGLSCTDYHVRSIGRVFKTSKQEYDWLMIYLGTTHELKWIISRWTNKLEILWDNNVILPKYKMKTQISFPFHISNLDCSIVQIGSDFDFRINSCSFLHLMAVERNQKYFAQNEHTSNIVSGIPSIINNNVVINNNVYQQQPNITNNRDEDVKMTFKINAVKKKNIGFDRITSYDYYNEQNKENMNINGNWNWNAIQKKKREMNNGNSKSDKWIDYDGEYQDKEYDDNKNNLKYFL